MQIWLIYVELYSFFSVISWKGFDWHRIELRRKRIERYMICHTYPPFSRILYPGYRACEVGKMGWDVRDFRRLSRHQLVNKRKQHTSGRRSTKTSPTIWSLWCCIDHSNGFHWKGMKRDWRTAGCQNMRPEFRKYAAQFSDASDAWEP